jgi:4-hydroxy-tetrahydrodipicolinate synthase
LMGSPKGVIPALSTPTTAKGELDEASLRSLVSRNIEWGVQGLAASIVAGEFYKFSDDERLRSFKVVIDEADGRVPVWAGVNHIGTEPAVQLAKAAKDLGANGIIAVAPLVGTRNDATIREHFATLLGKVDAPVMLQDAEDFAGVHIDPSLYVELASEHSNFVSVKIEGGDTLRKMKEVLAIQELGHLTVLGGMGAKLLIQELELGTGGTIPASCLTDIVVSIYNDFRAGRTEAAKDLFADYKPWLDFVASYSVSSAEVQKETSRVRGIITSSQTRAPHVPLGDDAKRSLALIIQNLLSRAH